MSPLYKYIKNQYLLNNFSDEDLNTLVSLKRIIDDERKELLTLK